jgi:hypothetical protein
MRPFRAAFAAFLFVSGLSAAVAQPLAPGRPAGVRPAARLTAWQQGIMLGSGAVILAAGGFLLSGKSSVLGSTKIISDQVPFTPPNVTVTTGSTT